MKEIKLIVEDRYTTQVWLDGVRFDDINEITIFQKGGEELTVVLNAQITGKVEINP